MYREYDLYHHGISGQKWGQRNGPPYPLSRAKSKKVKESGSIVSKAKKKINSIKKAHAKRKAAAHEKEKEKALKKSNRKPDPKNFSNEELREMNSRMQLEIDFNNKWNTLNPRKVGLGEKFVKSVAKDVVLPGARKATSGMVEYFLGETANKALREVFDDKTIDIFSKNKHRSVEDDKKNAQDEKEEEKRRK